MSKFKTVESQYLFLLLVLAACGGGSGGGSTSGAPGGASGPIEVEVEVESPGAPTQISESYTIPDESATEAKVVEAAPAPKETKVESAPAEVVAPTATAKVPELKTVESVPMPVEPVAKIEARCPWKLRESESFKKVEKLGFQISLACEELTETSENDVSQLLKILSTTQSQALKSLSSHTKKIHIGNRAGYANEEKALLLYSRVESNYLEGTLKFASLKKQLESKMLKGNVRIASQRMDPDFVGYANNVLGSVTTSVVASLLKSNVKNLQFAPLKAPEGILGGSQSEGVYSPRSSALDLKYASMFQLEQLLKIQNALSVEVYFDSLKNLGEEKLNAAVNEAATVLATMDSALKEVRKNYPELQINVIVADAIQAWLQYELATAESPARLTLPVFTKKGTTDTALAQKFIATILSKPLRAHSQEMKATLNLSPLERAAVEAVLDPLRSRFSGEWEAVKVETRLDKGGKSGSVTVTAENSGSAPPFYATVQVSAASAPGQWQVSGGVLRSISYSNSIEIYF